MLTIQGLDLFSEEKAAPVDTVESRDVLMAEECWYAIQTGVFSSGEAATQKADDYAARGAPGTVVSQGGKWRVFIACYGTQEDAMLVKTRLEENQEVDTYLYPWQCPEVRLRLTGKVGQMDAVEAGLTLMTTVAATLRDAAIDLDAGELTTEEAVAIALAMKDAIVLWEETVSERFGRSKPDLVTDMLRIMKGWKESCTALEEAATPTQLSAALKETAMTMYGELIAWRRGLLGQ